MKPLFCVLCVLTTGVIAAGQEKETTKITTKTTTVSGGHNLLNLWSVDDAVPVPSGQVSLRLGGSWETASSPANGGASHDDFSVTPAVFWGVAENLELSFRVPVYLGEGGNVGPLEDGNYDTYVGAVWRFKEQEDYWPAMALGSSVRVPTGDGSSSVDGELRLLLTNEYDSDIRSHVNGFVKSVNGNNDPNSRDFQWGVVLGLDGPLSSDGSWRWVADYMHRSSKHFGAADMNLLDVGWEWAINECNSLGMSVQIGLDDNDDTPNFGAGLVYAYSLGS